MSSLPWAPRLPAVRRLVQLQRRLDPEGDAGRPELDDQAGVRASRPRPADDAGTRHAADDRVGVREHRPDPLRPGRHVEPLANLDHSDVLAEPEPAVRHADDAARDPDVQHHRPSPARNSSTPALTSSSVRACWPRQPNARATAPRSGVGMAEARASIFLDTNFWYSAPSASSLNTAISSLTPQPRGRVQLRHVHQRAGVAVDHGQRRPVERHRRADGGRERLADAAERVDGPGQLARLAHEDGGDAGAVAGAVDDAHVRRQAVVEDRRRPAADRPCPGRARTRAGPDRTPRACRGSRPCGSRCSTRLARPAAAPASRPSSRASPWR